LALISGEWFFLFFTSDRLSCQAIHLNRWSEILRPTLLQGAARANEINGFLGNDTLEGAAGNDVILGGAGNDRIEGGAGNDTLTGGQGEDRFLFNTAAFGQDTITGWQDGQDLLDFRGAGLGFGDFTLSSGGGTTLSLTADPTQFVFLPGIATSQIDQNDFL